jgi:hypothetical protein
VEEHDHEENRGKERHMKLFHYFRGGFGKIRISKMLKKLVEESQLW